MALKAYEEFSQEPLAFPINGKTYCPPVISAQTGIALIRALAGDPTVMKQESRSLWQMVLGPAYDEMVADDVPLEALARAGFAMLVDWQNDRAAAERVWESGLNPEARAALAAATTGQTIPRSTRRAAAATTRTRASGTTTTTRKPAKKATRSTGSRSSRSGR